MLYIVLMTLQVVNTALAWWRLEAWDRLPRLLVTASFAGMAHRRWLAYQAHQVDGSSLLEQVDRLWMPGVITVLLFLGLLLATRD